MPATKDLWHMWQDGVSNLQVWQSVAYPVLSVISNGNPVCQDMSSAWRITTFRKCYTVWSTKARALSSGKTTEEIRRLPESQPYQFQHQHHKLERHVPETGHVDDTSARKAQSYLKKTIKCHSGRKNTEESKSTHPNGYVPCGIYGNLCASRVGLYFHRDTHTRP